MPASQERNPARSAHLTGASASAQAGVMPSTAATAAAELPLLVGLTGCAELLRVRWRISCDTAGGGDDGGDSCEPGCCSCSCDSANGDVGRAGRRTGDEGQTRMSAAMPALCCSCPVWAISVARLGMVGWRGELGEAACSTTREFYTANAGEREGAGAGSQGRSTGDGLRTGRG